MGAIDFLHNLEFSIAANVQLIPQCMPSASVLPHIPPWLTLTLSIINFVGKLVEPGAQPWKFFVLKVSFFHATNVVFPRKINLKRGMMERRNYDSSRRGMGLGGRSHLDVLEKNTLIIKSLNYTGFGCKTSSEHVNSQMWYNHFMHFYPLSE